MKKQLLLHVVCASAVALVPALASAKTEPVISHHQHTVADVVGITQVLEEVQTGLPLHAHVADINDVVQGSAAELEGLDTVVTHLPTVETVMGIADQIVETAITPHLQTVGSDEVIQAIEGLAVIPGDVVAEYIIVNLDSAPSVITSGAMGYTGDTGGIASVTSSGTLYELAAMEIEPEAVIAGWTTSSVLQA